MTKKEKRSFGTFIENFILKFKKFSFLLNKRKVLLIYKSLIIIIVIRLKHNALIRRILQ